MVSCIISLDLNCITQLKKFYNIATKVSSRKKCYYFWWSTWLLTISGSDNGLSPGRRQAISWTYAGILSIWPLGINFSEMLIEILRVSLKEMRLKGSSAKWRPLCLGLNVLNTPGKLGQFHGCWCLGSLRRRRQKYFNHTYNAGVQKWSEMRM